MGHLLRQVQAVTVRPPRWFAPPVLGAGRGDYLVHTEEQGAAVAVDLTALKNLRPKVETANPSALRLLDKDLTYLRAGHRRADIQAEADQITDQWQGRLDILGDRG